MSIGENIRRRRLQLNMTQEKLAELLGYKTRSSIAKIEKGITDLTHAKLNTVANCLHTTVDYLINGEKTEIQYPNSSIISLEDDSLYISSNSSSRKCIAIILAGGNARVNKYSVPFQFVQVKEKPIILYTLETFQRHPQIDEIYIVCLEGWEDFIPPYVQKYNITKLKGIIPAGLTGVESIKKAVEWLSPHYHLNDLLIIQEATRPFVDANTISKAITYAKQRGNAVVFERLDWATTFLAKEGNSALTHLNATQIINVQSPEIYSLGLLRQSFLDAAAICHPLTETICAVFLHNIGKKLNFCEGTHNNIRIIYEEDIKIMEALV